MTNQLAISRIIIEKYNSFPQIQALYINSCLHTNLRFADCILFSKYFCYFCFTSRIIASFQIFPTELRNPAMIPEYFANHLRGNHGEIISRQCGASGPIKLRVNVNHRFYFETLNGSFARFALRNVASPPCNAHGAEMFPELYRRGSNELRRRLF